VDRLVAHIALDRQQDLEARRQRHHRVVIGVERPVDVENLDVLADRRLGFVRSFPSVPPGS
jgi:hypothetical protein